MRWRHLLERLEVSDPALATLALERLKQGEREYRDHSLQRPPTSLVAEALEEAADLVGWLALLDRAHPLDGGALALAQTAARRAQQAHTALDALKQRLEEGER